MAQKEASATTLWEYYSHNGGVSCVEAVAMTPGPRTSVTSKRAARPDYSPRDPFASVMAAFALDPRVACGGGKGFGSAALKVDGRIFAMMSSKAEFVVKLPARRVAELVRDGLGRHFEPGSGKKMKEWLALRAKQEMWIQLAAEARQFVGNRPASTASARERR